MKTIDGKYYLELGDLSGYDRYQTMYAIFHDENKKFQKRCVYKTSQDVEETEVYLYCGDNEHEPEPSTWQDQPAEDGYYWYKIKYQKPEIVKFERFDSGKELIDFYDGGRGLLKDFNGKWYGPIKTPKDE